MERLSIELSGTFDLAQWCKLLRDRGWTGLQVARSLGRSEGYVNNLIRILERAALEVLVRWKTEQLPGSSLNPICATDWLMRVCLLPPEQQRAELAKRARPPSAPADGAGPAGHDAPADHAGPADDDAPADHAGPADHDATADHAGAADHDAPADHAGPADRDAPVPSND